MTGGYRLSPEAANDLRQILARSGRLFGATQRSACAALINLAVSRIADDPGRPGSVNRDSINDGFRSYAVRLAGRRRAASPHVLFYILFYIGEAGGIVVLRILHEAMDVERHLRFVNEG